MLPRRSPPIGDPRWRRPVARNDHTDAPAPVSATGYADGRMIPPLCEKGQSKHDKAESREQRRKIPPTFSTVLCTARRSRPRDATDKEPRALLRTPPSG